MGINSFTRPKEGNVYATAIGATSDKNSTPFTRTMIEVYPTETCYIKFGGSGVTVSASDYDKVLFKLNEYLLKTGGHKYMAILRLSTSGTAYISQVDDRTD